VAFVREPHNPPNGVKDLRYQPIGSVRIFLRDILAYLVEVCIGLGMERVAG
jgi:hypothetical protein